MNFLGAYTRGAAEAVQFVKITFFLQRQQSEAEQLDTDDERKTADDEGMRRLSGRSLPAVA